MRRPTRFTGSGLLTAALDMEGTGSLRLAVSNAPAFPAITANAGTLIFDVQVAGELHEQRHRSVTTAAA